MKKILAGMLLLATAEIAIYAARAQTDNGALVVAACGAPPQQYAVGSNQQLTVNTNGQVCQ